MTDELLENEKMPREKYLQMYKSVGAALEVYNVLHRGMEEAIYQEALELELAARDIPFIPQMSLKTWYKGHMLKKEYFADIVTYDDIVIELKSASKISKEHRAQLFNYLRISKKACGLLINYGDNSFYCERYWYVKRFDDYLIITKENISKIVSDK